MLALPTDSGDRMVGPRGLGRPQAVLRMDKMHFDRKRLASLICVGAALALAACAAVTGPARYPATWAPLDPRSSVAGCPDLAGTYSNRGSGTSPPELGEPPQLSEVFARMGRGHGLLGPKAHGEAWPEATNAASVSISQTPEALGITFIGEHQEQTSLSFRRYHFNLSETRYDDLFTCYPSDTESRLRFFAEPESHSAVMPGLYAEGGGTLVFLLKAADGSLVVQWRSESVAMSLALIGSHVSFKSVWWRYASLGDAR